PEGVQELDELAWRRSLPDPEVPRHGPSLRRRLFSKKLKQRGDHRDTRHYVAPNLRRAARGVRGVLLESSLQLEIPEKVRRNAALTGETGRTWLTNLPQHIVELERRWAIKVEQPVQRGSEAFVAEARTRDGLD